MGAQILVKLRVGGGIVDITSAVSAVDISSSVGMFASAIVHLVPEKVNIKDGDLNIYATYYSPNPEDAGSEQLPITRNSVIDVYEVHDTQPVGESKVAVTNLNLNDFEEAIQVFSGVFSDCAIQKTANSKSIVASFMSEVAHLDTAILSELTSYRKSGGRVRLKTAQRTPEATLLDAMGATIPDMEDGTDNTNINFDFLLDEYQEAPITVARGYEQNEIFISPWPLVRMAVRKTLEINYNFIETEFQTAGMQSRMEYLVNLLYNITVDNPDVEGSNRRGHINMSHEHYKALLHHIYDIIALSVQNNNSLWSAVQGIMKEFVTDFSPALITNSLDKAGNATIGLGRFESTNPYHHPTLVLKDKHITAVATSVQNTRSIVRSIGFDFKSSNLYGITAADPFEEPLERVILPNEDGSDYLPGMGVFPEAPLMGRHIQVGIPSWIEHAGNPSPEVQFQATEAEADVVKANRDRVNNSVLNMYLRSVWCSIVKATTVMTIKLNEIPRNSVDPANLQVRPLTPVLVSLEEGNYTGLIKDTRVVYDVKAKTYTTSLTLSHVTNTEDKYYRCLSGTLDNPVVDLKFSEAYLSLLTFDSFEFVDFGDEVNVA